MGSVSEVLNAMHRLSADIAKAGSSLLKLRDPQKTNFLTSRELTFTDHEDCLRSVLASFDRRISLHQPGQVADDRIRNPATILIGAPGSGKSRALDEIAAMDSGTIDRLCAGPVGAFAKRWAPVLVTWNSRTPYTDQFENKDPMGTCSLAARMLYEWWFVDLSETTFAFKEILDAIGLDAFLQLSPVVAAQAILQEAGKYTILICIDELLKASPRDDHSYARALKVLGAACGLLDAMPPSTAPQQSFLRGLVPKRVRRGRRPFQVWEEDHQATAFSAHFRFPRATALRQVALQ